MKYDKNPVLTFKDLPEGASKADFRDPKIWKEKDGNFYCVIGSRPADGSGQILLYRSKNGFEWEFVSTLAENKNRYGKMWECPDFFELDGKYVLLTSPQDMIPEGMEYHNGNGTLCIIGDLDSETHTLKEQSYQSVDYGIDCYAMQTLLAPDGRRIMIAWLQNWDTLAYRRNESKWFAQMSLPRELSVKNGRLYQVPVRELDSMRANKVEYRDVVIKDTRITLDQIEGRTVDLELVIRPVDKDKLYKKFELCFAENEKYHSTLRFRPDESVLICFRLLFEKQFRTFQTIRNILIWNFIDVIDIFKPSAFGVVRRKLLQIHIPLVDQFMEGSTNCRFTLFTDFHQSGNGIVPVTGQTQYFGHQPNCFQTEFLISQMMIAHDREVGVLMHSDNR